MTFAAPLYFLLLLLLIPATWWHFFHLQKRQTTLKVATTESFRHSKKTWRMRLVHLPVVLRALCFIALVIALARPQTNSSAKEGETEGIDIMMAMDISTSMLTADLRPNRIEAAKRVGYEFIANRPNDNIGLTLFGGEAFLQCPLTTNHGALLNQFRLASCSMAEHGIIAAGTAVGMGIANAVTHLEKSSAKSKVIILLTDGANNTGEISPLTASEMAKKLGIRIYTISVGTDAPTKQAVAQLPNGETYEATIDATYDPETLKQIAQQTGGQFYRATSVSELRAIYKDIDNLEKSKLKVKRYDRRTELFPYFALCSLALLILDILLRITWLRRIP